MPDPEVVKEPTTSDKINSYVDALPENDDNARTTPVPEPVKQPEKAPKRNRQQHQPQQSHL